MLLFKILHNYYWDEPHSDVEKINGAVFHAQRTAAKMGLQHTTEICYGGSCTNKHNKHMDASIQVLCNAKYLALRTNIPY